MGFVVMAHSIWRWVVLVAAVVAIVGAFMGRSGNAPSWSGKSGRFYSIALDLQVLIGLIIWVGYSGWGMGAFFGYIHPIVMLVALSIAHMGRGKEKKALAAGKTEGVALWSYVASLALILGFIPWAS